MDKEYLSYEQSLILQEFGFDEPCCGYYKTINKEQILFLSEVNKNIALEHGVIYKLKAPLFQQAFRFFREKYGLYQTVDRSKRSGWFYYSPFEGEDVLSNGPYLKWELAEQALLERMIEFVKLRR